MVPANQDGRKRRARVQCSRAAAWLQSAHLLCAVALHGSFFRPIFTKCHPLSVLSDCSWGVAFPEIRPNKRTMLLCTASGRAAGGGCRSEGRWTDLRGSGQQAVLRHPVAKQRLAASTCPALSKCTSHWLCSVLVLPRPSSCRSGCTSPAPRKLICLLFCRSMCRSFGICIAAMLKVQLLTCSAACSGLANGNGVPRGALHLECHLPQIA
jgi:hypothetical protein